MMPATPLDRDLLLTLLPETVRERTEHFLVLERTGSTNADLMARGGHGIAFEAADEQTAGRGRREKLWQSRPGSSLAFSLAFSLQGSATDVATLPLAVGASCVTTLRRLGYDVTLKWPNDLVHLHASGSIEKLGGILVELRNTGTNQWRAVCGIGLNITAGSVENLSLDQPASYLQAVAADPDLPREFILADLLTDLVLTVCEGPTVFPAMLESARAFDCLRGQDVRVIEPLREWIGCAQGWSDQGHLLVTDRDGVEHALLSAEVSIRRKELP